MQWYRKERRDGEGGKGGGVDTKMRLISGHKLRSRMLIDDGMDVISPLIPFSRLREKDRRGGRRNDQWERGEGEGERDRRVKHERLLW